MPAYGYRIENTGEIVVVEHTVALTPINWGELCMLCSLEPEEIPSESKVTRLISTTGVASNRSLKKACALPNCKEGSCPLGGC